MFKKFSYALFQILKGIDFFFKFFFDKSFISWFKDFLLEENYKVIKIQKKNVKFFVPNNLTEWRVKTFYTKEPETLDWIDRFNNTKKFNFWDIGSNIGLYSIYAALRHSNCNITSFEPSANNLRVLTRNIALNNLEKKINIFTNPLTNQNHKFLMMQNNEILEGGALNTFGEKFNFEGKKQKYVMKYKMLGMSIKSILDNKILSIPEYIKIDVDGIEHLILEGASHYLKNKRIKSISIEINENFKLQKKMIINLMKINNFKFTQKKQSDFLKNSNNKFNKSFNYIFEKKNF